MQPLVFVSSTVNDLLHVREIVRETIEEIGYRPVMSERGEIGYMSRQSAEQACYRNVKDCQIMVLIIGQRYGSVGSGEDGLSVTQNEYRTFVKSGGNLITLVAKEVLANKCVRDANPTATEIKFPGMDENAEKVFSFIDEVASSEFSNGILPYTSASEIKSILKLQFADLVYRLLAGDSPRAKINDILSEVQTLRASMSQGAAVDKFFLRATRYLLNDNNADLAKVLKKMASLEDLVKTMKDTRVTSFDELCKALGIVVSRVDAFQLTEKGAFDKLSLVEVSSFFPPQNVIPLRPEERKKNMIYAFEAGFKKLYMTDTTNRYFNAVYESAIKAIRDA